MRLNKFLVAALLAATAGYYFFPQSTFNSGWVPPEAFEDPHALEEIPVAWYGDGEGKTRLLYQDYEQVYGYPYIPRSQGAAPSCVGHATAAACDILAATQIASGKQERAPPGLASAATIYGWSRLNIGEIRPSSFGGGSHCIWAVGAIQKYGVVAMIDYGNGIDLSDYNSQRAIKYGYAGVPEELIPVGRRHLVIEYIRIDSYEEARDAIFNGCPIVVGSNVGFGNKGQSVRDSEGFLNRPYGFFGRPRSHWNHAMALIGACDEGRQGCLVLNSWGLTWVTGPKRFGDEPDGSFWADADEINNIVSQGDSYAIRMFIGYPNYRFLRKAE